MPNKNPFTNPDGTPKQGKEFEFLDWNIEQDKQRINALPKKEREKVLAAKKHLKDKMES